MTDLASGARAKLIINPGEVFRVSAPGQATVTTAYGAPDGTATINAGYQDFGPYSVPAKLLLLANSGPAAYTLLYRVPLDAIPNGDGSLTLSGASAGAISDLQRDALLSDSRDAESASQFVGGTPTNTLNTRYALGVYNALCSEVGRYNCLVQNAGVSGDTTTQALARMRNTVRGKGFGIVGVDFTTGAYLPTNPGVAGFGARNLFIRLGVNNAQSGIPFATTKADVLSIISTARDLGYKNIFWFEEPALGDGHASTAATRTYLANFNTFLRSLEHSIPGFYALDIFSASVDASNYTKLAGQTILYRDDLHQNNQGAKVFSTAAAAKVASVLPPTDRPIARSDLQNRSYDASSLQLVRYPCNGASNGAGDPTANNWFGVNISGGSSVDSIVAHPDGYGRCLKAVVTCTGNNSGRQFFGNDCFSRAIVGKRYFASADVIVTGTGGVALSAVHALKELKLQLFWRFGISGTETEYAEDNAQASTGDVAYLGSFRRTLVTPPMTFRGGSGGSFSPVLVMLGNAANAGNPFEVLAQVNIWELPD